MRGVSVVLTVLGAVVFTIAPGAVADILPRPLVFRFSRDGPGVMVCRAGKEFQCGTGCCGNDTVCFEKAACCPKGEKCIANFIGKGTTQDYCKSFWEEGCPGSNTCCPDDAPRCREADFYGAGCWASTLEPRGVIPTATAPTSSAVIITDTTTSCTEESPHLTTPPSSSSRVAITASSPVASSPSTDVKSTETRSTVLTSTSSEETPASFTETLSPSKTPFNITTSVQSSPTFTAALNSTDVSPKLSVPSSSTLIASTTTILPSLPGNSSTISITQTSTQPGNIVTLTIFPSHSTFQVSSSVHPPVQSRNYTVVYTTQSIVSITNTHFWKNITTPAATNEGSYTTGWVSTVPVGNATSTVWTTSKPSGANPKFPTPMTMPLSNTAASIASPASGLSVMVSALALFFLFLSGHLNTVNAAILVIDAAVTKSMLVVAFVTAYVFFGAVAAAVGGTTIGQFLAVY